MKTNDLLTVGQFAKLAGTTKRTITWYDQEDILQPFFVDASEYRYYKPEQIIDFQVILLLRQLNFSIDQIKALLGHDATFKELFHVQRDKMVQEIENLKKRVEAIDLYYTNFEQEGIFVKPVIKKVAEFDIYCLQKVGPYSKIFEYGRELASYFQKLPKHTVFVAIYEEAGYKPVQSRFKVGIVIEEGIIPKREAKDIVKKYSLPSFRALSYTYTGSPSLLSFHWKQLEKYARKKHFAVDKSLPFTDIEVYQKNGFVVPIEDDEVVTEMYLPIE